MPQNLFAACRINGELKTKRVPLGGDVQQAVTAEFSRQEEQFRSGVTNEIDFDGRWKPDENEFLTIDVPAEAQVFHDTIEANATAVPSINTKTFEDEGIRALFTGMKANGITRILVQRFTSQQVLERKFTLFLQGGTFRHMDESAFTLDSSLVCIIEDDKIKFKSQQKLRSIIDMSSIYRAATDQEIQAFAEHPRLEVKDIAGFLEATDQISRKQIHALIEDRTLEKYGPIDIKSAAQETGLDVDVQNEKIVMPSTKADIKMLLQFLDESRYAGPLSGDPFVTNSRRPAKS